MPAAAEVLLYAILRVYSAESGFSKKVDSTGSSSSSSSSAYDRAVPLCSRITVLDRPDSPYRVTPAAEALRGREEPEPGIVARSVLAHCGIV